jgi:hypothetical protein
MINIKIKIKELISKYPKLFKIISFNKLKAELFFSSRLRDIYLNNPHLIVFDEFQSIVQSGPFKGMKYIKESFCIDLVPKILGSYEKELNDVIDEVIKSNYGSIINIGAAEGYYTVGLAYKMKQSGTRIVAYESNEYARRLIKKLASLNGVINNIKIHGEATHNNININDSNTTFILCDIEGFEYELLDPLKNRLYYKCDFLIEVHDSEGESHIVNTLLSRFKGSHSYQIINSISRSLKDSEKIKWIKDNNLKMGLINENRTKGLKWLLLKRLA